MSERRIVKAQLAVSTRAAFMQLIANSRWFLVRQVSEVQS